MSISPYIIKKKNAGKEADQIPLQSNKHKFQKAQVHLMKKIYGNEEKRLGHLKPKTEIPPELQRKLRKEQKNESKQKARKQ